jgi:hypothetical protein
MKDELQACSFDNNTGKLSTFIKFSCSFSSWVETVWMDWGGQLVAGLLGVEAGQDAVIRRTLWNFADKIVAPYNFTVTNFTDKVSDWRNSLSHAFVDEGLVVPISEGANGQTTGNVLAGNNDSLAFARTAEQVFATVYGTGSASKPGGFFPKGADGVIAKHFLKS